MDIESRPAPNTVIRQVHRLLPSRWLKASVVLHLTALVAVLINYRWWPLALGALLVNHVVLALGGLLPRSRLLGPNWTRLPKAATKWH